MSVIFSIFAKKVVNSRAIERFLAEIEGIQALSIRHTFRVKVSTKDSN